MRRLSADVVIALVLLGAGGFMLNDLLHTEGSGAFVKTTTLPMALVVFIMALAVVLLVWPRPLPETRPTHDLLGWPARWPVWGLVVAVSVVAGSAVYVGPGGRPGVHPRWADGFHKFTWGAGIEAMRKAPKG